MSEFIASMNSLVKFRPTDEHLFTDYLLQKVRGEPLPSGLIKECNLYSEEPWRIFDTTFEQTFYIFTTLSKKKSRVFRTAGSGTWKEQHTTKITDSRGELLGYKKSFRFRGGRGSSETSRRWIMNEFSMYNKRCMCVLCKIKYYSDKKKSKDKPIVISDDVLMQFKDKNRQAKSDFAVALPSSTVDGAQPFTSQAISSRVLYAEQLQMSMGVAPALHLDNNNLSFPGFSSDAIANSLAPMVTATATATAKGWTTTELDSVVYSAYNSESRSVTPVEEGSHTNLSVRASSPPAINITMTMTPGPDIGDLASSAFGSITTLNSLLTTRGITTLNSLLTTRGTEARYASYSPSFGCNQYANVLPKIATSAQIDMGNATYPAFEDGAYADLLPPTAEQVNNDDEWMDRLMNMKVDPVVDADTKAMLASTHSKPDNQTWGLTSLHQQRSVAESQEQ